MTIRLTNAMHAIEVEPPRPPTTYHLVFIGDQIVALSDTRKEALEAKRAFENVLAPRFTRDEAIAIVRKAVGHDHNPAFTRGLRAALEALAAAGAFVDGDVVIRDQSGNGNDLVQRPTMTDLLDAAGIR